MKNEIILLLLLLSCCTLLDTPFQKNSILLSEISPTNSNVVIVYVSDASLLPTNSMQPHHFRAATPSNYFHPDSIQILPDKNCILLNFAEILTPYQPLYLEFPNTNAGVSYLSAPGGYSMSIEPQRTFAFCNSMDSEYATLHSAIGPAMITTGTPSFAPGKWGNGVDCGSGTSKSNCLRIPGNTIPMSDFTIEFWYTKTSKFAQNQVATFFYTSHQHEHFTNHMTLQIADAWVLNSQPARSCIRFGVRINTSNNNEVYLSHDFGSLAALNAAFPLNTPVHIAVTKRNSDGRLQIFLNNVLLPGEYAEYNPGIPYINPDTSVIANKSGYFPFETWIGNINTVFTGEYPAGGVIDNFKVYPEVRETFYTFIE